MLCHRRVKRHNRWFEVRPEESASAEPDVPPLPTITFDITEPRPVTAESAFLFEKFARTREPKRFRTFSSVISSVPCEYFDTKFVG